MSNSISKQPMDSEVVALDSEKQEIVVQVNEEADVALRYLVDHERITYTPDEERKVKRKLDMFLLPILAISFALSFVDKVTISYAAVYGMRTELGLVHQQYSWANSIFFFGFLFGQIPCNYLSQRLPIGKLVAVNIAIWGALVMLCGSVQNFAGLATVRFLMGLFEACIMPCSIIITSMFYTRAEQPARICVWFSALGLALILGGLVAYGIGHIDSDISRWRVIFLIFGGTTIGWSSIVYIFLPDLPFNARFLNDREKAVAIERLRDNRTGVKCFVFKWSQAMEAFRDPQVWLMCLWYGTGNILNIAASFLPLLIHELGFTGLDSTLYTMPTGAAMFVTTIAGGIGLSYVKNYRTVMMFILTIPSFVGVIMLQVIDLHHKWARLVGVWLLLCIASTSAILLSLVSSNVAGFSKKITTTSLLYIFYCIGSIVSPQLFLTSEEKSGYKTGVRAMLTSCCLSEIIVIVLGGYYIMENKRRDKILKAASPDVIASQSVRHEEFLDRTDRGDSLKFRYRW